jgi:hypothetical protein
LYSDSPSCSDLTDAGEQPIEPAQSIDIVSSSARLAQSPIFAVCGADVLGFITGDIGEKKQ